MKAYKGKYYQDRNAITRYSAETILSLVIDLIPDIRSAVDIGCGVGAWLAVLKDKGIKTIQGVDGPWVQRDLLVIPPENFLEVDLQRGIAISRRFDLAISLEVAEHLPPACAERFVEDLIRLSDVVLFSAAIPYQGGRNHFNEQWPDYWARLFSDRGYTTVDAVRSRIWNDNGIPYWYRQNVLLYVGSERAANLTHSCLHNPGGMPLALIHPQLYLSKQPDTLKVGWTHFRRSIRASFKRVFVNRSSV